MGCPRAALEVNALGPSCMSLSGLLREVRMMGWLVSITFGLDLSTTGFSLKSEKYAKF